MKGHVHVGEWCGVKGVDLHFLVAFTCDSTRDADAWLRKEAPEGTYSILVENAREIVVQPRVIEPQSRNVVTTGERRITRKRKETIPAPPEPELPRILDPAPRPRGRFF